MGASFETKPHGDTTMIEGGLSHDGVAYDLDKEAKFADYKADAVEAENEEHNMGVLDAVKAYPMASFWAFVMSATIVSRFHLPRTQNQLSLISSLDHGVL